MIREPMSGVIVQDRNNIINSMNGDVRLAQDLQMKVKSQAGRRAYVRIIVDCWSVWTEIQRSDLARLTDHLKWESSKQDRAYLDGPRTVVGKKGKLAQKGLAEHSIPEKVRIIYRVYGNVLAFSFKVDTSRGWQSFLRAVQIGKRLREPGNSRDLIITKKDLADVGAGHKWFIKLDTILSQKAHVAFKEMRGVQGDC